MKVKVICEDNFAKFEEELERLLKYGWHIKSYSAFSDIDSFSVCERTGEHWVNKETVFSALLIKEMI